LQYVSEIDVVNMIYFELAHNIVQKKVLSLLIPIIF